MLQVLDLGQVTADTTNPRRKPEVRKNNDSGGLRYVQPSDLGVEIGFRAFLWNVEENGDGYLLNTKRGDERWVSVFVEQPEYEINGEAGLDSILSSYLEASEGASIISRGTREVQSFPAVWATYTQPIEEVEFYYYSTAVLFDERLVTFHTWSLQPDWQDMDETLVEFLSNIR